jgi:hypothetical protein
MRLDAGQLQRIITDAIAERGVVEAWTDLLAPALIHTRHKYASDPETVEVEHLLSAEVSYGHGPRTPPERRPTGASGVHRRGAAPPTAGRAGRRPSPSVTVASRLLGGRVPPTALRDASAAGRARIVVRWSQTTETAHLDQTERLRFGPDHAPKMVLAAGPGWDGTDMPDPVHRPGALGRGGFTDRR